MKKGWRMQAEWNNQLGGKWAAIRNHHHFPKIIWYKVPLHFFKPLYYCLSRTINSQHHVTLQICSLIFWSKASRDIWAEKAMHNKLTMFWDGCRSESGLVNVMRKWSLVGQVYISIQYEFINRANGMLRWSECHQEWKSRFIGLI